MERTEIGMNKIIKVSNLSRDYSVADKKARSFVPGKRSHKTISAVKSISFEIGEGETVGFIGPNGAGKSTTIKMLAGILHPTQEAWRFSEGSPINAAGKMQKISALCSGRNPSCGGICR